MKIDLFGRIALVTGAGGQLGRTIAVSLAKSGADVAVHYRSSRDSAEKVAAQIRALGRRACLVKADVGDPKSVNAMRAVVLKSLGSPDIIVNNAVASYPWKTVLQQDLKDYESQFKTSVLQNVLMAKAFVPAMIKKRWGRVIAINTECSIQNLPSQSAYVSGKRGMDGVLRVLAREIGESQVTVNQVAPGWMISADRPDNAQADGYRQGVPLKRRGHDQDIANAVVFLASEQAGFISGAFLPVCGGNAMVGI